MRGEATPWAPAAGVWAMMACGAAASVGSSAANPISRPRRRTSISAARGLMPMTAGISMS